MQASAMIASEFVDTKVMLQLLITNRVATILNRLDSTRDFKFIVDTGDTDCQ
jgi:hypothetical protein